MAVNAPERKLAAILAADVVGYSRLVAEDEEGTLQRLRAWRRVIDELITTHGGRVFGAAGDSVIAELTSPVEAVRCAVTIQDRLRALNADLPEAQRMWLRIGINLGDVVVDGNNLLGDGVNIAARLEGLAAPGGICISANVHEHVRNRIDRGFEELGDQQLKNIPEPVRVFRVGGIEGPRGGGERGRPARGLRIVRAVLVATAAVALAVGVALWLTWPRPLGLVLDLTGLSTVAVNPPLPDKPSIVVLPFVNMSGDAEQEYFADGMTEDLTTELSRSPSLFVISRSSAFTYKNGAVKAEDVARELGVRYVVEGSVRTSGNRIRITVQLIDATTGFHAWSQRYDRELTDFFAVQDEVSEHIMEQLVGEIRHEEMLRRRRRNTQSLQAYEAFLRGISHFEHFERAENLEARRWFQRATEIDPGFADAWALVANTYMTDYTFLWNVDPDLLKDAEETARRALDLDPRSADALVVHSHIAREKGHLEEAASWAERAIEVEPNFDVPYLVLGIALAGKGDVFGALRSIKQAARLNPKSPNLSALFGMLNFLTGRTGEGVELLERARAANKDLIIVRLLLGAHYQSQGDAHKARALVEEVRNINPELTVQHVVQTSPGRAADDAIPGFRKHLRAAGLS